MRPRPPSTRRPATCCSRARISCWRSVSIRPRLTLSGEPFKVADNVGVNRGVSLATLAASSAGAIAYATAATTRLQFAWFDRSGAEVGRVGTPDTSPVTNPALSPDGRTLAFARLMDGNWDIWLMEMARGVMTRLTSELNLDFVPVWMSDNTQIIYQSVRGVEADLYRRAIGSKAELLIEDVRAAKCRWMSHATDVFCSLAARRRKRTPTSG